MQANLRSGLGRADEDFWQGMGEKALGIARYDYNVSLLLVVDGPCRGQMWGVNGEAMYDSREGFWPECPDYAYRCERPFKSQGNEGMSFLDWYEHWLDAGLKFLEVEI